MASDKVIERRNWLRKYLRSAEDQALILQMAPDDTTENQVVISSIVALIQEAQAKMRLLK